MAVAAISSCAVYRRNIGREQLQLDVVLGIFPDFE